MCYYLTVYYLLYIGLFEWIVRAISIANWNLHEQKKGPENKNRDKTIL